MELDIAKGLKLGKTIVIGRSVGINPKTSQKLIFSEDQVEINVVPLNAIKIQTPLRRALSGTVLPASVWAAPNISPLILGIHFCLCSSNNIIDIFVSELIYKMCFIEYLQEHCKPILDGTQINRM